MSKTDKPEKTLSLAEKRQALDALLEWFESDDFVLEQALEKYAAAEQLADQIQAELETYQNKIEVLKQRFDGV